MTSLRFPAMFLCLIVSFSSGACAACSPAQTPGTKSADPATTSARPATPGSPAPDHAPRQDRAVIHRQVPNLEHHAPIRVGVCHLPPYAFRSGDGQWSGLAVSLFQHIANSSGLRFSFVEFNSMVELTNAVENRAIDFAAVAVDPTPELELSMNFTHAFEKSGTSVAVAKHQHLPLLYLAQSIWHSSIPSYVAIVLVFLIFFGVVVGLIERKKNSSQFGGGFWRTIGEGVWWSSSTISTVGYGDRVPMTKRGRYVGGLWMLVAFALTSILAGLIASVFTVARINSQIHTSSDLARAKCGAVEGSAAMMDGENLHYNITSYLNMDSALKALHDGKIDAVLGETVRLGWLVNQPQWSDLFMLPEPIVTLYSVFPVSTSMDPGVLDAMNYHLLKTIDTTEWETLRHLYLGDQS